MANQQPSSNQAPAPKGYGKRSTKQWVLIYVVVGAIVYALIYLLFMRGDSGGSLY